MVRTIKVPSPSAAASLGVGGRKNDTAGCNCVKRSGSGDGVLDGIQSDITEESRKNYSQQYAPDADGFS